MSNDTTTEIDTSTKPIWHQLSAADCARRLDVDVDVGLTSSDAAGRKAGVGPNRLEESAKEPAWRVFIRQYQDFMQLILLGAAVVSFLGQQRSVGVLLIVLTLVNAILGYRQESKAEESVAALREMLEETARALRDGQIQEVDVEDLVPGDVVMIEAGDSIPADGRLIKAATLEVEESALTGESLPVGKATDAVGNADAPLGDRTDMVYMNSLVTRGSGSFVVATTGMSTEVGRIAKMLGSVKVEKSPLQRQMDDLAKAFAGIALIAVVIVVVAGLARGLEKNELFLLATSIAIAAIPTGLPTVVTSLLSIGTQKMADEHAIVKQLSSVETLGSTSAICSDKTGTLTLNKMTARVFFYGGNRYSVSGEGYDATGRVQATAGVGDVPLEPVLMPMALCSDAVIDTGGDLVGDPTEGALVTLAAKGGLDVEATREHFSRIAEVPFDSEYKLMATFHEIDADAKRVIRAYVKGAPDVLVARSKNASWIGGELIPMDQARDRILEVNGELGDRGLRVLMLAQKDFDPDSFDAKADLLAEIDELTLLGMVGIVDPPRPEAKSAIAKADSAGIRVRMITGDHAVTAAAIAGELGIEGEAISGHDLDAMSDEEFATRVHDIGVFGRVAPEHKVRLVQALQHEGDIVSMTGDGVNDAPALKAADIGVAMGITGTEVAKQSARMILTDDNFATIVEAVHQGRAIYDNMLKYLRFQLLNLIGYVLLFIGAAVFNIAQGAPLNPMQVLWLNFAIVVPAAIGLGYDVASPGLMDKSPRPRDDRVLKAPVLWWMFVGGAAMAIATLLILEFAPGTFELGKASVPGTMAFVAFSLMLLVAALESRHPTKTVFTTEMLSNPRLLKLLGLALVLTILSAELRILQRWLQTVGLSFSQWGICVACAAGLLVVLEAYKVIRRAGQRGDESVEHVVAAPAQT